MGPSQQDIKEEEIIFFLKKIKEIAKKENSIFLHIEPFLEIPFLKKGHFYEKSNSLKRFQPQRVLILDLKKSEEEIFNNISSGTRYNIKLAQRKGVKIISHKAKFEEFYKLLKDTAKRQKFCIYQKEYFKKLLEIEDNDFKTELFLAEYNTKIISAIIMAFFNKTAISLHSASDYQYRKLKANSLLRWQTILRAKKENCEKYDFWGIDEKKWPSLTYFKKNFGGKKFEYPESIDIIFQTNWYKLYKIFKKVF